MAHPGSQNISGQDLGLPSVNPVKVGFQTDHDVVAVNSQTHNAAVNLGKIRELQATADASAPPAAGKASVAAPTVQQILSGGMNYPNRKGLSVQQSMQRIGVKTPTQIKVDQQNLALAAQIAQLPHETHVSTDTLPIPKGKRLKTPGMYA
jgi:hypothetical protein